MVSGLIIGFITGAISMLFFISLCTASKNSDKDDDDVN